MSRGYVYFDTMLVCQVNPPSQSRASATEDSVSDLAHAKMLSGRVNLHNGVWLVDDNIRLHDTVMVKLSVRFMQN